MKLAAMQPYFFPYLGYFDLLNIVDEWIVFDISQYRRHAWLNRNRVLHPVSGWQYIIVPVRKHHLATPIKDIQISMHEDWRSRIMRQLKHYQKDAPYYVEVSSFLEDCFLNVEEGLAEANVTFFKRVAERLGIKRRIHTFSEMNLQLDGAVECAGDWGLRIAQAMGAKEFINRPGGAGLFDRDAFRELDITLSIQSFRDFEYACGSRGFQPNMSIIEVMMWNSPREIMNYLNTFRHREDASSKDAQ